MGGVSKAVQEARLKNLASGREKRQKKLDAMTPEEKHRYYQESREKGAVTRRKYKTFQMAMKALLSLDVTDAQAKALCEKLGLDASFTNAICASVAVKAATQGDVEAARFVRDTVGEKPTDALNLGVAAGPVKALDLGKLSDRELEALADREDSDEDQEEDQEED